MMTQKQKTITIYSLPLVLLCIPLLGSIISKEINWSVSDFLVAGVLLFSTAFLINLVRSKIKKQSRRILLCLIVLIAFILVWIELAVGIFGSPFAGN